MESIHACRPSMPILRIMSMLLAQAGLARVCLAGDDPVRAMGHVEDILSYLESGTL
jgi:hypothetical protein